MPVGLQALFLRLLLVQLCRQFDESTLTSAFGRLTSSSSLSLLRDALTIFIKQVPTMVLLPRVLICSRCMVMVFETLRRVWGVCVCVCVSRRLQYMNVRDASFPVPLSDEQRDAVGRHLAAIREVLSGALVM